MQLTGSIKCCFCIYLSNSHMIQTHITFRFPTFSWQLKIRFKFKTNISCTYQDRSVCWRKDHVGKSEPYKIRRPPYHPRWLLCTPSSHLLWGCELKMYTKKKEIHLWDVRAVVKLRIMPRQVDSKCPYFRCSFELSHSSVHSEQVRTQYYTYTEIINRRTKLAYMTFVCDQMEK